jgi:hypothetical protein
MVVIIIIIMKCVFFFSLFIFSTRTQNCVNPSFSYIFCVFQKGVHCRGGQTYQVCANSCARTSFCAKPHFFLLLAKFFSSFFFFFFS